MTHQQYITSGKEDKLPEAAFKPPTRWQLMPVWFKAMNVLLLLLGVIHIFRMLSYVMVIESVTALLSYNSYFYYMGVRLLIIIFTAVPALLFFLQQKHTVYWAMVLGILRTIISLDSLSIEAYSDLTDYFMLFLTLTWAGCIAVWTFHAFNIRRQWLQAQPEPLIK